MADAPESRRASDGSDGELASANPQPRSRSVRANGVRLHYVDWGDPPSPGGGSPTLLLVHGDMRTSRSWDAAARRLRRRFRVIALDSRGHGDSDWPNSGYKFADRVEDLEAFCDAAGLRSAVAVAHSTGGVVAALLAERRPDIFSRLMLLEPMVVVDEAFQRMVSTRAARPRRTWSSRGRMYEYLKAHPMTGKWADETIRDVVARESYELPDGRLDMKWATASMDWREREGDYLDITPTLRTLGKPILFVVSDSRADAFRHLIPIARETPNFELLTIADSAHNMYMDQPAAVADAAARFAGG